jgi:hypothetical protein
MFHEWTDTEARYCAYNDAKCQDDVRKFELVLMTLINSSSNSFRINARS